MTIDLTFKEITDLRRGLIIAMKEADDCGDVVFSDELEQLHDRLSEMSQGYPPDIKSPP